MFDPAPAVIREFHLSALRNAYALMAGAAETGKPHACWAHHMSVGGARTADQLVALGYFIRRLDAKPGQVDTFRYRITAEGCATLGQPYLVEDLSMSDQTPAPDAEQTSPAESVDLSYPPRSAAPELKIVEAQPSIMVDALAESGQEQAPDILYSLTPDEAELLAKFKPGEKLKVSLSSARVDLTKRGLITLLYRRGLYEDPYMHLTPLGEAAAALQAEMRVPSDNDADDADEYVRRHDEAEAEELKYAPPVDEDDESEARQRFTFKRGDRVKFTGDDVRRKGITGTVDSQDIYPIVLFRHDGHNSLIRISEHDLTLLDTPVSVVEDDDDSPRATQEIPAVELTGPADDAVKDQVLKNQTAEIVELRFQLAAIKRALADEDGAIPEDPAAAILALKLHVNDQQRTVEGLSHSFDELQQRFAVVEQERDVMKREVTGLKLQIANLANSADMGVQHERTDRTTPADITARTLAGWTAWHKFNVGDELVVIWERKPNQKPARRDRSTAATPRATGYANPAPRPASVGGALQPDSIVIPVDMPADPAYRPLAPSVIVIGTDPEPVTPSPMSAVMSSFTRNLHAQFEANPLPQYADRPAR